MLKVSQRSANIQSQLEQILNLLFAQQFNRLHFLQKLAQIADDQDLKTPANLLFILYNVIIEQQPEIAYSGFDRIQKQNGDSLAYVSSLVIKSAYEAYAKKYKQSIDSLKKAVKISQHYQTGTNTEFKNFYTQLILRMIEIFEFTAFKKQYYTILQDITNKYQNYVQNSDILKIIQYQKQKLKSKVCLISNKKNPQIYYSQYSMKYSQTQKKAEQSNYSSSEQDKLKIRKKRHLIKDSNKFINPYSKNKQSQQVNRCIFM